MIMRDPTIMKSCGLKWSQPIFVDGRGDRGAGDLTVFRLEDKELQEVIQSVYGGRKSGTYAVYRHKENTWGLVSLGDGIDLRGIEALGAFMLGPIGGPLSRFEQDLEVFIAEKREKYESKLRRNFEDDVRKIIGSHIVKIRRDLRDKNIENLIKLECSGPWGVVKVNTINDNYIEEGQ